MPDERKKELPLELKQELITAGYQGANGRMYFELEELIEACGEHFYGVFKRSNNNWGAWETDSEDEGNEMFEGRTPTEAVARLWLALNKKV